MSEAKTKAGAAVPAAASDADVHTSAQPTPPASTSTSTSTSTCAGCGCSGGCDKPKAHQPTPARPRDAYTGQSGVFTRDPATGERRPVTTTTEKD